MIIVNKNNYFLFLIVSFLLLGTSCAKTAYEKIKQPYNNILHFEVEGYGGISKVLGVVENEQVTIYWTGEGERPATIEPIIKVSDKATISPASGESVAFTNQTDFTVTAEDGTKKVYKLNPVFNTAIPVLLGVTGTRFVWVETKELSLFGQYFFASADTSDIKVYAQRLTDGYEFDIPVKGTTVTATGFNVVLPTFTAVQDSGWHKIWVKVKGEVSGSKEVYFEQPWPRNANPNFSFVQNGQHIHPGQELTLNYNFTDNYGGAVSRYYKGKAKSLALNFVNAATNQRSGFEITNLTVTDTQIKFKVPEDVTAFLGRYLESIYVRVPQPTKDIPDYSGNAIYQTGNATTILKAAE